MTRYILENGIRREMTDAEEDARDAEEALWANGAVDRAMDTLRTTRNRLLVETDSPYLSPEPFRGKTNQPSHIIHTIKKLAEIRNSDYDQIIKITNENFFRLFTKLNKE